LLVEVAKQMEWFTALTDRLLSVSKETVDRRMKAFKEREGVKPGPKRKADKSR